MGPQRSCPGSKPKRQVSATRSTHRLTRSSRQRITDFSSGSSTCWSSAKTGITTMPRTECDGMPTRCLASAPATGCSRVHRQFESGGIGGNLLALLREGQTRFHPQNIAQALNQVRSRDPQISALGSSSWDPGAKHSTATCGSDLPSPRQIRNRARAQSTGVVSTESQSTRFEIGLSSKPQAERNLALAFHCKQV